MCNQYSPSDPHIVAIHFKVTPPAEPYKPAIGPWGRGPFVRNTATGREAVVGQWALIADNARDEAHIPRAVGSWSTMSDPG
jgi:hypothetical protein